jgi:hypothetical protein
MRVISSIELGIKTFFGFLITMRLAHNPQAWVDTGSWWSGFRFQQAYATS